MWVGGRLKCLPVTNVVLADSAVGNARKRYGSTGPVLCSHRAISRRLFDLFQSFVAALESAFTFVFALVARGI